VQIVSGCVISLEFLSSGMNAKMYVVNAVMKVLLVLYDLNKIYDENIQWDI